MQQKKPDDFVIATGKQYSIRQFIMFVVKKLNMKIVWKGKGLNEIGIDMDRNRTIIKIDKKWLYKKG